MDQGIHVEGLPCKTVGNSQHKGKGKLGQGIPVFPQMQLEHMGAILLWKKHAFLGKPMER